MTVEAAQRRAAVFGYRLRFAPETQPIRQTVVDNIVLHNLRVIQSESGKTVGKLGRVILGDTEIILVPAETKSALVRLHARGLVTAQEARKKLHWRLTAEGKAHLAEMEQHASGVRNRVTQTLFGTGETSREAVFFFDVLARMFDEITTSYLEAMFSKSPSPVTEALIRSAIAKTGAAYSDFDRVQMSAVLMRFFADPNPEFDWIKWTYCKNYYSLRAVGLGAGGDVLSATIFKGATFYLDTNFLIEALDESSQMYLAARQVLAGLKRIGCHIGVLEITLFELRDFATQAGQNLPRVLQQIPDGLLRKVAGPVARAESRRRNRSEGLTPEDIIQVYSHAEDRIETTLGGAITADEWFDIKRESREIAALAESLRRHYAEATTRSKTEAAAIHDALALAYIESKHRASGYFLTLDSSLPRYKPASLFEGMTANRAITLASLMPWMGAVSEDDDEATRAFSAALSSQLVPPAGRFSLQEFRMLAELDMDCGKMPSEDVEQCLLYLRREAKELNLAKAEDRERLHAKVKGFFSSPDRKYLAELVNLNARIETLEGQLDDERRARRSEGGERIEIERQLKRERLRGRARRRLAVALVVFIALEVIAAAAANRYADGNNMLQKVGNTWWLFLLVAGLCGFLARWLCRGALWDVVKHYFHPEAEPPA